MTVQPRPVIFGEVLYDCFPDGGRVLGGAPFNVAWHCQAFGLNPLFISRVGTDELGENIRVAMIDWGMDITGLQTDAEHPTGMVSVTFDREEPSYEIVENSAWDFIHDKSLPELDKDILLYHGSLALRNPVSAKAVENIKKHYQPPVFVDINLRAPWWNTTLLKNIIKEANWLKLNQDELDIVMAGNDAMEKRMQQLLADNSLELLIVTLGEKGVTVIDDRLQSSTAAPKPSTHVVDTVGAGDAFSSIVLTGRFYNWPLELTLQRAQQFASAIVGIQGATTNDTSFYRQFIKMWNINI